MTPAPLTNMDAELAAPHQRLEKARAENEEPSTFRSIFFPGGSAVAVRVTDYQRAFSWEQKQIELFLGDLDEYQGVSNGYYFGHFIAQDIGEY